MGRGISALRAHMSVAIRRVLVATDFSETSVAALRWAVALVDACQGALHLLHVLETVAGAEPLALNIEASAELERNIEARAWDLLQQLLPRDDQVRLRVELALEWGIPLVEILRYAASHDIDLIALGASSRDGVTPLVGHVAEGVVRGAPCPVLTVRVPRDTARDRESRPATP